ncbi:MAG: 3-dehydroquinate synthase [Elusimicrobiota bacterium]
MKIVKVKLDNRTYPIYIGVSLANIGNTLKNKNFSGKILVITNTTVCKLYSDTVIRSLSNAGFVVATTEIPDGEKYKTLKTVSNLYYVCMNNHLERNSIILALGGGVVGDIAGFVASTYLRGLTLIQVPTTLLSQVDSSVGGKVGVNLPKSKNMVGTFYQPSLVYIDTSTLKTLPEKEFNAGLAEVIKYGIIMDKKYFTMLEKNLMKIKSLTIEHIEYIVWRACQLKKRVVEFDEKECEKHGLRIILNFGHTIGHAIESATNYKTYLHGEAISIGMVCASKIALELGLFSKTLVDRVEKILVESGLPIKHNLQVNKIIEKMAFDKKILKNKIRFVLSNGCLGKIVIKNDVPDEVIRKVLEEQK